MCDRCHSELVTGGKVGGGKRRKEKAAPLFDVRFPVLKVCLSVMMLVVGGGIRKKDQNVISGGGGEKTLEKERKRRALFLSLSPQRHQRC